VLSRNSGYAAGVPATPAVDIRADLKWVKEIERKYQDYSRDTDLKAWLTLCLLNQDYDVISMTFTNKIVTFVYDSQLFNIVNLDPRGRAKKDRTILLSKHLQNNFGVTTLSELRRDTVCDECDICSLVDDIQTDILSSQSIDDAKDINKVMVS